MYDTGVLFYYVYVDNTLRFGCMMISLEWGVTILVSERGNRFYRLVGGWYLQWTIGSVYF